MGTRLLTIQKLFREPLQILPKRLPLYFFIPNVRALIQRNAIKHVPFEKMLYR